MSKNWAICIGINDYYSIIPLKYAQRDAAAIRDFCLNEARFEKVYFFAEGAEEIQTVYGSPLRSEPTFGNLERFFDVRFREPFLEAGDNLWFFFAGHGIRHENRDYLMPLDGDLGDLENSAIPLHYISERLRRSGADNVILLIDACRSDKEGRRDGFGFGSENQQGVITIFSCSPEEPAYEIEELQQGAFTHALLESLRLEGEGNCATVERLYSRLRYRVPQLTQQYKRVSQTPYGMIEPPSKNHLILLPRQATLTDVIALKNDALIAELSGDFKTAKQLWIRVLMVSPGDLEAIAGIERLSRRNSIKRRTVVSLPMRSYSPPQESLRSALPSLQFREATSVDCYVHAEMDDHVLVQRVTTVEVILSKYAIEFVNSATAKSKKIRIDDLKSLIVQVIPKLNFESVGDTRTEIEFLSLETPQHLYFDLRPTHLGEGEVWVVFRQSQLLLLTLTLTPQIVESKAQIPQRIKAKGSIRHIPTLSEPLHQLRIIERRNGSQITYDYELDSPSLNILGRYESKPITSDRQQYVETLYREIESRWCSAQEDVDAFTAELRGFGGQLLDELFPEALQRQLWDHRQEMQSIMVISTEPFIPWELVHLKPPGQAFLPDEVCFLGQLGLVRWLYDVGFPPKSITLQPDRCRYVIPHYPDSRYQLPQAEQEAQFLEQTFQATAIKPQPNPVRQALESASFDLLHFAGHGQAEHGATATANLLLEGRLEGGKYITASLSATTVSQYCRFKTVKNQPIVLLNACQIGRTGYALTGISGFAQAFLKGGAGAFIGSLWTVGDRPARVFSETLYSALLEGSDLAEASRKAREEAKAAGDATWLAYVVYGHPYLKVALQKPSKPTFSFDVVSVDAKGNISQREQRSAEYHREGLGQGIDLDLLVIPGGSFQMGSAAGQGDDDERPQHNVAVEPFLMGRYPVTQAQWRLVAGLPKIARDLDADPSNFKGNNRPVEQVDWDDATEFCQRLAKHTNRAYRLPSEAEWEYACRAGTTTAFHFGETLTSDLANYNANYVYGPGPKGQHRKETTNIGSFPANAFGLHDMHGNVWEWCQDHWYENYVGAPVDGSAWITGGNASSRLLRGGSWRNNPDNCRSANRLRYAPTFRYSNVGFRVVCASS
jgi:formylglycine-generating enzyme required for sulfatase activity/uncharacterized caspase-like protein